MTTSLKVPAKLKARVRAAAKAAGTSPHAFMLGAIERVTDQAERRRESLESALASEKAALESGELFAADDVEAYIRARLKGGRPRRPRPKPWLK